MNVKLMIGNQKMKSITRRLISVVIISVIYVLPSVGASNQLKGAKLLVPETIFVVEVGNFAQLQGKLEKTGFYKLCKDPVMKAFVDDFKAKLHEKIQSEKNDVAKAIFDKHILPEGKAVIALVLNKQALQAKEPMALFISEWGQNLPKIKEAVEETLKKALEDGASQRAEDYRGVTIKTLIGKDSQRLGFGLSSNLSYCFVDDCLMGSEDIELLKFAVAHLKGATSPALADDPDYTSALAATGPNHDIDLYFNIKQMLNTIIAEDTNSQAKKTFTNLGIDNVASFACSVGFVPTASSSYNGKAILKINGPKKGICKLLEVESDGIKIPRFVPSTASSVTFFNLNIKKAFDELANILANFNPMYAAWMYAPLPTSTSPDEPGLRIKEDIIDHFGSEIIITENMNKPFTKSSSPEYLVACGAANPAALEKSLSVLHNMFIANNNPEAKREFLGRNIYVIDLSGIFPFFNMGLSPLQSDVPTARQGPKMAFTITDTHIVFGTESAVEGALRTLSDSSGGLSGSSKWFTAAKSNIPSVVGAACLENLEASVEHLWWMMKESKKDSATNSASINMTIGPNPAMGLLQTGLFDFGLLPEFEAVRKYFGLSTFYGISKPEGFFFEFKEINPN